MKANAPKEQREAGKPKQVSIIHFITGICYNVQTMEKTRDDKKGIKLSKRPDEAHILLETIGVQSARVYKLNQQMATLVTELTDPID